MNRARFLLLALLCTACGEVTSKTPDATPNIDIDSSVADADAAVPQPSADAAIPPDACVRAASVSAQFVVNNIVGTGASSLDVLLNHNNGFILSFDSWDTVRAADDDFGGITFKHGVKSTAWRMDYTGQDGDFLDMEVGQFLNTGGVSQGAVFELGSDGSVYLYVLPQDTTQHPYMELRCFGATFEQDVGGYPVLASMALSECSIVFFDFRSPVQKNIIAERNVNFELTYQDCAQ